MHISKKITGHVMPIKMQTNTQVAQVKTLAPIIVYWWYLEVEEIVHWSQLLDLESEPSG